MSSEDEQMMISGEGFNAFKQLSDQKLALDIQSLSTSMLPFNEWLIKKKILNNQSTLKV
jgi:hypothetical protein